jgi:hypothetical protein
MKGVTGGSLPAKLWAAIMSRASEGVPVASLPDPGRGAQPDPQPSNQPSGGTRGQGKDSVIGRLLNKVLGGGGGGGGGSGDGAVERLPPSGSDRER